ncbi:MAG: hypothetical protein JO287_03270 [Pseudonocardiales bacterium]|nr:hypothetical protein [Pseudonocardiales bacterium]
MYEPRNCTRTRSRHAFSVAINSRASRRSVVSPPGTTGHTTSRTVSSGLSSEALTIRKKIPFLPATSVSPPISSFSTRRSARALIR